MNTSGRASVCLGVIFYIIIATVPTFAGVSQPGIILYGKIRDTGGTLLTSGELTVTFTPSTGSAVTLKTNMMQVDGTGGPYSYRLLIPLDARIAGFIDTAGSVPISDTAQSYSRTVRLTGTTISKSDSVNLSTANGGTVELVSIGISPSDVDDDGFPDTWEQQIIDAKPGDSITAIGHVRPEDDFDGDGDSNWMEYENNTNPTDPASFLKGDVDDDDELTLSDAIVALQTICGIPPYRLSVTADINRDGRIGIEEAIHIMQVVSGIR